METFDLCVVGAGISGVCIAELSNSFGLKTILLDENESIGCGSTLNQHGWFHIGALYSSMNNQKQKKIFLQNLNDLDALYSRFKRMNLYACNDGFTNFRAPKDQKYENRLWFNNETLEYKFDDQKYYNLAKNIIKASCKPKIYGDNLTVDDKYFNFPEEDLSCFSSIMSGDRSMNTDIIMSDIFINYEHHGGIFRGLSKVISVNEIEKGIKSVNLESGENIFAKNVVFCGTQKLPLDTMDTIQMKTTYSPLMLIKNNLKSPMQNFVQMSQDSKKTINLISHKTKFANYAVVGSGENFSRPLSADKMSHIAQVWSDKLAIHGIKNFKVIKCYTGQKNFLLTGDEKFYFYHIKQVQKNIYYVNPGKFTLAFTLAKDFLNKLVGTSNYSLHNNLHNNTRNPHQHNAKTIWEPRHQRIARNLTRI